MHVTAVSLMRFLLPEVELVNRLQKQWTWTLALDYSARFGVSSSPSAVIPSASKNSPSRA